VLQEACATLARLHRRYPARADFVVHVNVSPRQLAASNFAHDVERILKTTVGMVPECLVLELTESEPAHSDVILRQLARLKGLGVRLALDDFGTAFASLSNLRETTFDLLKVDRSFISGLTHRPIDFKLARTVIELGQMFHLDVVAEGVERYDQVVQLRSLGCKLAQGYFFSRPVSADAIAALIAQDHPRQRRTSRAETA
jgi:EAL domain-containing protein (putative c-di-GMP-specific phosphodiesterase class I)